MTYTTEDLERMKISLNITDEELVREERTKSWPSIYIYKFYRDNTINHYYAAGCGEKDISPSINTLARKCNELFKEKGGVRYINRLPLDNKDSESQYDTNLTYEEFCEFRDALQSETPDKCGMALYAEGNIIVVEYYL